ncbi:leucine-rich repeat-containing protein 24 [Homalodisca vitripennis]|nr:leucine-rich repeat-containing protein 24 [Homalodisca vitripennis]XP_046663543.1 leucine-rich repeat-containing protein 24 [Homalodisca vitripennis]KAG8324597.1 Leucine rich repeat C-terminal domain [Homalodisca vitripennis]
MIVWIVLVSLVGAAIACPTSCLCKWKGGKQTIECINKNLITIPDGMDQGTQVLDFSGNNLKLLPRERFQRMGLTNLQKIFLARCRISQIDDRAFRGLTNLVELDLSYNYITSVPTETFLDYSALMRLTLNNNPIRYLKSSSFQPLKFLLSLEMTDCQMEVIEDDAFNGLESLEWLKLDKNRLLNIKGSNILPDKLNGIALHSNPWQCDCRLVDFRDWMVKYKIPQTVEPKCNSPVRLRGRLINSLEPNELACLPDVTPTTLYLEIAEGKNVSLLCRVSAIPEAKVSWWFQGTILQNDSMVAPGLHLYYFVEEGGLEKKSELFIFNTNIDDNGTFVCIAENPAGKSQSNFTIRIVLKEEPLVGLAVFPYEYVILISGVVSVLAIFLILIITVCFMRCRKQRRKRKKKDRSKVAALHNQQNSSKAPGVRDAAEKLTRINSSLNPLGNSKINGSIILTDGQPHDMMLYATEAGVLVMPNHLDNLHNFGAQNTLKSYQVDQNPDLLNDTENGKDKRIKGNDMLNGAELDLANADSTDYVKKSEIPKNPQWRDANQRLPNVTSLSRGLSGSREVCPNIQQDVHLSPRKFIGNDGYPLDYGLPKISGHFAVPAMPPAAFYRTLPHKSRQNAANPSSRFSREAEFLSKSVQPPSYEHYSSADVRYTVEGYPCGPPTYSSDTQTNFTEPFLLPSPPAAYKSDPVSTPRDAAAQWPETSPDSVKPVTQCSVAAQTSEPTEEKASQSHPLPHHLPPPVLTESPDEGYGGDGLDTSDM